MHPRGSTWAVLQVAQLQLSHVSHHMHIIVRNDPESTMQDGWGWYDFVASEVSQDKINVTNAASMCQVTLLRVLVFFTFLLALAFTLLLQEVYQ
jgi:hypothetical protein